jgi:soluble lytic murein transglycosylase
METFVFCLAMQAAFMPSHKEACKYSKEVIRYSEINNVEPEILFSLISYKSKWKPTLVSKMGACGLTQVKPRFAKIITGKHYTCKQLLDPETSIKVGAAILKANLDKFGGNYNQALCFYNQNSKRCHSRKIKQKGTTRGRKIMKQARLIKKNLNASPFETNRR